MSPLEFEIDPNIHSRAYPALSPIDIRHKATGRWLKIGDEVVVVQPDDPPEPDWISTAVVEQVAPEHGLAYVRVDWAGFHDRPEEQA